MDHSPWYNKASCMHVQSVGARCLVLYHRTPGSNASPCILVLSLSWVRRPCALEQGLSLCLLLGGLRHEQPAQRTLPRVVVEPPAVTQPPTVVGILVGPVALTLDPLIRLCLPLRSRPFQSPWTNSWLLFVRKCSWLNPKYNQLEWTWELVPLPRVSDICLCTVYLFVGCRAI